MVYWTSSVVIAKRSHVDAFGVLSSAKTSPNAKVLTFVVMPKY